MGPVIREGRKCKGMTLKEASAELRISIQHLSMIERNKRRIPGHRLADFAKLFDLNLDYLCYLYGYLPGDLCDHGVTPEEVSNAFNAMRHELIGHLEYDPW